MDGTVVDFTWTPLSGTLSYTIGGNTYPYTTQADSVVRASDSRYTVNRTPTETPVSFTANVKVPAGRTIVSYRWEFGDGLIGYGPVIVHAYTAEVEQRSARLIVTDDKGRVHSRSRMLNLLRTLEPALRTQTTLHTSLVLRTRG